MYGHPRGFRKPELITVPWLEIPHERRKNINRGKPAKKEKLEPSVVDERLKNLGYK
jgi:hypothetical protein